MTRVVEHGTIRIGGKGSRHIRITTKIVPVTRQVFGFHALNLTCIQYMKMFRFHDFKTSF